MRRRVGMRHALAIAITTIGCLAGAQRAAAVAPVVTFSAGPAQGGVTNDNTPTFAFAADQANVAFGCSLDAPDPSVTFGCASPYTTAPLPEGGHTFTVAATNAVPETGGRATRSFVVDTTPPETSITDGPREGEVINSDAPAFSWASSDTFSTFTCTADGVPLASCEQAYITGASNGQHTFTVAATDRAGNTDPTPATRTFTIRLTGAPPDVARCQVDGTVIIATRGNDTRIGARGTELMYGLGGNDLLRGLAGADCLIGGSGNDRLFAGSGNDYVFGNTGTDRLSGEAGNDELYGNAGNDRITGGSGGDLLDGSTGNDHISDAVGRDSLSGGPGNDRVDARDTSRAGRSVPDTVKCGTGRFDVAIVDRRDRVARDCERVRRR